MATAAPAGVLPPAQTNLLENALPVILQLCLSFSGTLKTSGPAAESEPRKLAFKLYTVASFVDLPLILVVVAHLMAPLTGAGAMQPPNSNMVKRIMWVALAVSYIIFALGTVRNLMH